MKQQFLKDIAGTIRMSAYASNVQLVPSSATIVLKKPGGATLQASASATVASDGEMTYSLTTTHTATLGLNYIAEWTYVVGGITYYQTQLFDVVRSILAISVTDDDLFDELESLRNTRFQDNSTATSATSSTLLDTAERKEADDYWNGGTIEITAGTGANQIRSITDFVQSTSTITVSPNWVTTPDSTSDYLITRSYANKIEKAFKNIEDMLYNKGKRHQLILESSQISMPLKFLTIHNICLDNMSEDGDKWSILATTYWDKFNMAFDGMRLDYDLDNSGTIEGDVEEQFNTGEIRINRA